MKKICLVNIPSPFSDWGKGQIFLPNTLMMVASMLLSNNHRVSYCDLNIETYTPENFDYYGFSPVGMSYLEEVRKVMEHILKHTSQATFLLGGQAIRNLGPHNVHRLFENYKVISEMEPEFEITFGKLPDPMTTSMVPGYKLVPDEKMYSYITNSFSLFVDRGCLYNCPFCVADFIGGGKRSVYRSFEHAILPELTYLVTKAKEFDLENFSDVYLASLDVFQNLEGIEKFADTILSLNFPFQMHGLSGVSETLNAFNYPDVIKKLVKAGYKENSPGFDGSPEVWKKLKRQNLSRTSDILELPKRVLELSNKFEIHSSPLMVFGGPDETTDTLEYSLKMVQNFYEQFGATIRPHFLKIIPGSKLFQNSNLVFQDQILATTRTLVHTEFRMLPNFISNGSRTNLLEPYFRRILNLPYCRTKAVSAPTAEFYIWENKIVKDISIEGYEKWRRENFAMHDW